MNWHSYKRLPWLRLACIWAIGTCAAATSVVLVLMLFEGRSPFAYVAGSPSGGDYAWPLHLVVSGAGLAAAGVLCARAWRQGSAGYSYLGALMMALGGFLAVCVLITLACMIPNGMKDGFFIGLLVSFFGMIFNAPNLLLTAPLVIWFWRRAVFPRGGRAHGGPMAVDRPALDGSRQITP